MNQNTTPLCRMYTEKEAAAHLSVSVNTLRNWRSLRQGPRFVKLGKRCVRYHEADLASFANGEGQ